MRRWIALGVFVVLVFAATLPLRLALSWAGAERWLTATQVEGTIWSGTLRDARLRTLALGDTALSLDVFSLLLGRTAFRFTADGALAGDGVLSPDRKNPALRAASLRFPLSALSSSLKLDGVMQFTGLDIAFADGACRRAEGSALVTQARMGSVPLPADFVLRGALGCAGNAAVLRLTGQSQGIEVQSVLRIAADGEWRMESSVGGAAPRVDQGSLAL